jgi:hypothetical protein
MAPNGTIVFVDEITRNIIKCKSLEGVDYWMDSEYSWAIPVSVEWLLKFRFERIGTELVYRQNHLSLVFSGTKLKLHINGQGISIDFPKTIHQLQNLYFSLTSNELNISVA